MIMNSGYTDYHIHTDFSSDSSIRLAELLKLASQKNYSALAVTEHLDLKPQELVVYGLPSLLKYKNYLNLIRSQYPEIRIIYGIEVGDFHQVRDYAQKILEQVKFELVLGSVHFLGSQKNISIPFNPRLTAVEIRDYYEQNLALTETCPINVLSHLGVYKRYYETKPDESDSIKIIKQIFKAMISRDIALEINFSSFRKKYQSLLPEPEYLAMYRKLGGKLVTNGSDAHRLQHFHDYYSIAESAIRELGFIKYQVSNSGLSD